jgi:predicted HTH transcriptional regulator
MKKNWTEDEIKSYPSGEHDYFDRKSGRLLNDSKFRDKLAKVLSAFANSGGGQLLLGVNNDGTFDGVQPLQGNTPIREWIEQIIPNLLNPEWPCRTIHTFSA